MRVVTRQYVRVSTAKSLNRSNTLFDKRGNEHTGSGGTRISCVGNIGGLTGGSGFAFSDSTGLLPLSNIRLIAMSTFPSANARYCEAVASLSPEKKKPRGAPSRIRLHSRLRFTSAARHLRVNSGKAPECLRPRPTSHAFVTRAF